MMSNNEQELVIMNDIFKNENVLKFIHAYFNDIS